MHESFAAATL